MRQRTTINIEERIWRRFRGVVVLQGKDAAEVLEEICEAYCDQHEAEARRSVEPRREDS
jgi:hypothetical protein